MTIGKPNTKSFTTKVTAATTATQIFTSPWRLRKRYVVKKLLIANENAAENTIKFYDDDIADATTPARGDSTNAPLLQVTVPIRSTTNSGMLILEEKDLPREFYQGGLVAYASVANAVVMVEVEEE